MTTNEIKQFIYNKRKDGMTFEQIADILNNETDKNYTRQSVFGLYRRFLKKLEEEDRFVKIDTDILNIYCRVKTISGTAYYINKLGFDNVKVYESKVNSIVTNKKKLEKIIDKELLEITKDGILTGDSKSELIDRLSYKGISIKNKVYKELVKKAYEEIISDSIEKSVSSSLIYDDSKDVARLLVKKFCTNKSLTKILNKNIKK